MKEEMCKLYRSSVVMHDYHYKRLVEILTQESEDLIDFAGNIFDIYLYPEEKARHDVGIRYLAFGKLLKSHEDLIRSLDSQDFKFICKKSGNELIFIDELMKLKNVDYRDRYLVYSIHEILRAV